MNSHKQLPEDLIDENLLYLLEKLCKRSNQFLYYIDDEKFEEESRNIYSGLNLIEKSVKNIRKTLNEQEEREEIKDE